MWLTYDLLGLILARSSYTRWLSWDLLCLCIRTDTLVKTNTNTTRETKINTNSKGYPIQPKAFNLWADLRFALASNLVSRQGFALDCTALHWVHTQQFGNRVLVNSCTFLHIGAEIIITETLHCNEQLIEIIL